MKRGGPLRRTKGLQRKSGLEQGQPLERKAPLKRTPLKVVRGAALVPADRQRIADLSETWWRTVTQTPKGAWRACMGCGALGVRVEGHHTIKQQTIRREARSRKLDVATWLWDPRNGIPLCERCHEKHTLAVQRVPGYLLPIRVWEFARDLGLEWALEKEHPMTPGGPPPEGGPK